MHNIENAHTLTLKLVGTDTYKKNRPRRTNKIGDGYCPWIWWCHDMETRSTSLAIGEWNWSVTVRFLSHKTASGVELWRFLCCTYAQTLMQRVELLVIRSIITLAWRHCNWVYVTCITCNALCENFEFASYSCDVARSSTAILKYYPKIWFYISSNLSVRDQCSWSCRI